MSHEHHLYVILPHPHEARILALPCDSGWTLPQTSARRVTSTSVFNLFEFGMKIQVRLGLRGDRAVLPLCRGSK